MKIISFAVLPLLVVAALASDDGAKPTKPQVQTRMGMWPFSHYERMDASLPTPMNIFRQINQAIIKYFKDQGREIEPWEVLSETGRYSTLLQGEVGWYFRFWANEYNHKGNKYFKIAQHYMEAFIYDEDVPDKLNSVKILMTKMVE